MPWRRGFTLIEMLLVISLITMLISITLPALSKSRLTAREGICGSNLRQATIAFTAYSNDNNQLFPDMSYNPITKAQWSQPPYWQQPYFRDHLGALYGMRREMWYSPTNDLWNRDDFWWYDTGNPATSNHFVSGFFYFGSTLTSSAAFRNSLSNPPPNGMAAFPRRNGGSSYSNMIWADLNRRLSSHPTTWLTPGDARRWGSNHWYGNPDMVPHGSHRAFTDNHVDWITGSELKMQSTYGAIMYW
ncbi:MAG: type II secretion system protein [Phycisphaeraceae bacterium]